MSVMRVIVFHPCTTFKVRRSPLRQIWRIFRLDVNRLRDLIFDPCHMGFLLANFQLSTPFHSRLRVGTGQTERQTNRRRPSTLYAPLYVGGA